MVAMYHVDRNRKIPSEKVNHPVHVNAERCKVPAADAEVNIPGFLCKHLQSSRMPVNIGKSQDAHADQLEGRFLYFVVVLWVNEESMHSRCRSWHHHRLCSA